MKKIIVTGGMGYIGSHTVVSLLEQGFKVVIIDNLVNSTIQTLDGIEKISGIRPEFQNLDMCIPLQMNEFFKQHSDADAVIHFAALKAVGESSKNPIKYYRNNLFALLNLLEAMSENDISNLVFSSSATVYGEPDSLPLTEQHKAKPALSPYGNTKKIGEDIIRDKAKTQEDFNAISLRYFNPIGAHGSCEIGELPNGIPNNLMPFITQTAAGVRKKLLVYGDDYNTPDGTAIRDYIHVVDLAEAHVKTVKRLLNQKQQKNYEIFNLGTGKGTSVLEVIRSFEKKSGLTIPYQIVERRAGDVEKMYASTDKANNVLGWKSKYTLDDMTSSSWAWEKKVRGIKDLK